jgi:hypothetical protein
VPPPGSPPKSAILLRTSGDFRTAFASALRRATISGGVPAGAIKPYQADEYTPGTPISSKVGTFGNAGLRAFDATAKAFMRPAAMPKNWRGIVISDVPRDEVGFRGAGTFVGHVHDVDTGGGDQHRGGQVLRRADACRAVIHLAGIRLDVREQLLRAVHGRAAGHHEDVRHRGDVGDGSEVLQRGSKAADR